MMNLNCIVRRSCRALFLMALVSMFCGCGHTLRGTVVRGEVGGSNVELIHEIDQRLKGPGLERVEVLVHRDPNTPNRHRVGQARTAPDGSFSMTLTEFGSGWMDEQWLVQVAMPGYQSVESVMKLPAKGSKWQLLITLAPGVTRTDPQTDDFMQDYEKFK